MVLDNGPSCTVENDANFWVLDVSGVLVPLRLREAGPTTLINAVPVGASTPLGPSDGSGGGLERSELYALLSGDDGTMHRYRRRAHRWAGRRRRVSAARQYRVLHRHWRQRPGDARVGPSRGSRRQARRPRLSRRRDHRESIAQANVGLRSVRHEQPGQDGLRDRLRRQRRRARVLVRRLRRRSRNAAGLAPTRTASTLRHFYDYQPEQRDARQLAGRRGRGRLRQRQRHPHVAIVSPYGEQRRNDRDGQRRLGRRAARSRVCEHVARRG